jgi:dipeptidyl aminopeptidase/acylaminoacyl peptidase
VGDVAALAADTHKFESRYMDSMIGPYPEAADLYEERSPLHNVDGFATPVILLQGLDDEVVPPSQAEEIVAALDAKGIPHAYVAMAGEGHGFRKAENIERACEAEFYFYSRVFGFDPADDLDAVEIAHGDAL